MRRIFAFALLLMAATPAMADCPVDKIEAALASSTEGLRRLERDVTDVQSTEGGLWEIFREPDGRVHTIIRGDYGESGRNELRLSIVNRRTYGIASTRVDYLRHAFIEEAGPNGVARRTTTYYFYCDGKQYLPPDGYSMLDAETYRKEGQEAQATMILDKDVADFTKGLIR